MATPRPPQAPKAPPAGGTSPSALFERYKVAILAVAGLAVAGLAVLSSRSKTSTSPGTYSGENQAAGTSGYDSTASDVYNAIQPQLEYLSRLYEQRQGAAPIPTPAPTPTPTTPPTVTRPFRPGLGKALAKATGIPVGTVLPTPPRYLTPVKEY